ncbi:MAG: hypothetical protein DRI61_10795 [Chloroflexi bacterium]|nr:MAG: hypothetical protein DRI61_10795 [Chloroflexota bacterium]HDN80765.1 homogentisate 1,2-dioxygenase [Chloroflexota bacterium]
MYKVNISQQGARLTKPFTMIELAYIEDFAVSIYLCHGTLAWHKHLDQDELFLVHSGVITLDTEMGSLNLQAGELAVVPKGVVHRSSSLIRSEVLLFSPRFLPDRKNGDRRIVASQGSLSKTSLYELGSTLSKPYHSVAVAEVEDFILNVMLCDGTSIWYEKPARPLLFIVMEGLIKLEVGPESLLMERADLTLIPSNYIYRIHAPRRTLALVFHKRECRRCGPPIGEHP